MAIEETFTQTSGMYSANNREFTISSADSTGFDFLRTSYVKVYLTPSGGTKTLKPETDDYTLDKTLVRWYGPGIMFQTAIHLAVHLGVKSITTLGWDIADMSSFCDNPYGDSFQKHSYKDKSNIVYAPTPTNKHEAETVIKSTKFLNEWLMSKNIDFKIISETNPAHESIERVTL